jgi:2-polyprenyl-3-methyl-5-hydroxy-6-metoxy-1,4-benzoquinol methylase
MPEQVVCNLCGSCRTRPLFRLRDYRLQVDDAEWQAVRCAECGLGYLNPRPTREEMGRYYPEAYFTSRATQTARYERQAAYVPEDPGRLLDIGTARGDFLAVMKERGWEVQGVEPAEAAGNPHRLPIHRIAFPEQANGLPTEAYDVVTAWAVFEHLRDPRAAFLASARLVKPGGRVVVQVPNLRSIWARYALQEDLPRHLYFFDPRTLKRYGELAGLSLERLVHTTDLFGGSGRGVLRLGLIRLLGGSTDDFFEMLRTPRRERFRAWPAKATAWTAMAAIEQVILANRLVRLARLSGQVVASYRKRTEMRRAKTGSGSVP